MKCAGGRSQASRYLVIGALIGSTGVVSAGSAFAQSTTSQASFDPNPGAMTLSASIDLSNRYMFRGIRQQSNGLATWPAAEIGVSIYTGPGAVKHVGVNVSTWNSLHTGDTGTSGPSHELWYESDFSTTMSLGFAGGVSVGTTYTAYTSPNNSFSSVKEVMVRLSIDDAAHLHGAAVKPYVTVAQELDTAPGQGQADGGNHAGTYLEFGISPGYTGTRASLAVPVKVGLSLRDYYEAAGTDHAFGFASVAAVLTVPFGAATRVGAWNVHGTAEIQRLGRTTAFFNGGDRSCVIGSVGLGFSY